MPQAMPKRSRTTMPRRLLRTLPLVVLAAVLAPVLLAGPALAGGSCREGRMTDGSGTQVTMHNNCFGPTILRVKPGQAVTFVNRDVGIDHPVVGASGTWALEGEAVRFDKPGLYPYFCHVHVGMIGVIVVGDASSAGLAQPIQVSAEPALASAAAAQAADPAPAPAQGSERGSDWAAGPTLVLAVAVGALGALLATTAVRRRRAPAGGGGPEGGA
jgi:plastocyanin